jgi:hypothetical protein
MSGTAPTVAVLRVVLGVVCLALVLHLGMLTGGAHAPGHTEPHAVPTAEAGHLMLGVCLAVLGVGVGLLAQGANSGRRPAAVLTVRRQATAALTRPPNFWPPGPGRDRVEAGLVLRI